MVIFHSHSKAGDRNAKIIISIASAIWIVKFLTKNSIYLSIHGQRCDNHITCVQTLPPPNFGPKRAKKNHKGPSYEFFARAKICSALDHFLFAHGERPHTIGWGLGRFVHVWPTPLLLPPNPLYHRGKIKGDDTCCPKNEFFTCFLSIFIKIWLNRRHISCPSMIFLPKQIQSIKIT